MCDFVWMHVFVVKFLFITTLLLQPPPPLLYGYQQRHECYYNIFCVFFFSVTPATFSHTEQWLCVCDWKRTTSIYYYTCNEQQTLHIDIGISATQHLVKLATSTKADTHSRSVCSHEYSFDSTTVSSILWREHCAGIKYFAKKTQIRFYLIFFFRPLWEEKINFVWHRSQVIRVKWRLNWRFSILFGFCDDKIIAELLRSEEDQQNGKSFEHLMQFKKCIESG